MTTKESGFMSMRWALVLWAAFGTLAAAADGPEVRETWESLYMGDAKVGYGRSVIDRVEKDGQTVWRHSAKQRFVIAARFMDKLEMEMDVTAYETADGRLYAFDSTIRQSGKDIVSTGRLSGDTMTIEQETLGKKEVQSVAWGPDIVGMVKLENELRSKPLKTGEVRKVKTFTPGVNQIVEAVYTGLGPKKVRLLDKKERELLAVKMEAKAGGTALPATEYYLDKDGETLMSQVPLGVLSIVTYKATKAEALADADPKAAAGFDFGFATLLKVDGLTDARKKKAVTYKLTFKDKTAADEFPSNGGQKVMKREGDVLTVRVERRTPPAGGKAGPADEEFTKPNGFVQSDDPEIVKVANEVAGKIDDPWKKCQELERWVRRAMNANAERGADFSVAFSTAADTIRSRKGDCSEFSVLLAALCRAAGVPARSAMGLVYVESLKAFGYHMWTEVNIGGEWYALDGTIGEGSVGGEHLKILDSSLKGSSAMSALLPIVQVMGKLEINVTGVEE